MFLFLIACFILYSASIDFVCQIIVCIVIQIVFCVLSYHSHSDTGELFLVQAGSKLGKGMKGKHHFQTSSTGAASLASPTESRISEPIESPCHFYGQANQTLELQTASLLWYPLVGVQQVMDLGGGHTNCMNFSAEAFDVGWKTGFLHFFWEMDFGSGRYWRKKGLIQ